jgi:transposase
MEKAATRAVELGRDTLAKLLREEIVGYQRPAVKVKEAYQDINDWLTDNPDLTQLQVKRALAAQYGLFVSEVGKWLRRFKKVFRDSKREAQESRARQEAWRKATSRNHSTPSVPR